MKTNEHKYYCTWCEDKFILECKPKKCPNDKECNCSKNGWLILDEPIIKTPKSKRV